MGNVVGFNMVLCMVVLIVGFRYDFLAQHFSPPTLILGHALKHPILHFLLQFENASSLCHYSVILKTLQRKVQLEFNPRAIIVFS